MAKTKPDPTTKQTLGYRLERRQKGMKPDERPSYLAKIAADAPTERVFAFLDFAHLFEATTRGLDLARAAFYDCRARWPMDTFVVVRVTRRTPKIA